MENHNVMSISINMAKTLSLSQAEKYIGVSRATLWRIIRQYQIETQPDVLDRRIKRVRRADLDKVIEEANRVREGEAA
jgi:hypothetical protein